MDQHNTVYSIVIVFLLLVTTEEDLGREL